jgi:hypothetical protein
LPRLYVSHSFEVAGWGTVACFQFPPTGLVWGSAVGVVVERADGSSESAIAVVEAMRVSEPPGEVVAFRLVDPNRVVVPCGSYISFEVSGEG